MIRIKSIIWSFVMLALFLFAGCYQIINFGSSDNHSGTVSNPTDAEESEGATAGNGILEPGETEADEPGLFP